MGNNVGGGPGIDELWLRRLSPNLGRHCDFARALLMRRSRVVGGQRKIPTHGLRYSTPCIKCSTSNFPKQLAVMRARRATDATGVVHTVYGEPSASDRPRSEHN